MDQEINFESVSKVDRDSLDSFLQFLLATAFSRSFDYDANFRSEIDEFYNGSAAFLRRFKLSRRQMGNVYRGLMAGKDPTQDRLFSEKIADFFGYLNLKENKEQFAKELDLRREDLKFISDCRLYFTRGSAAAAKAISKYGIRFSSKDIRSMLAYEDEEQHNEMSADAINEQLRNLVAQYSSRAASRGDTHMPESVLTRWKNQKEKTGEVPAPMKEYNRLLSKMRTQRKNAISMIVRRYGDSSGSLLSREVNDRLRELGFEPAVSDEFVGRVRPDGRLLTLDGRLLQAKVPVGKVTMAVKAFNKDSSHFYCKYISPMGKETTETRVYIVDAVGKAFEKKYTAVAEVAKHLDMYRKRWGSKLKARNPDFRKHIMIIELAYQCSSRISSTRAEYKGETTYGLTTLEARHVTIRGNTIILKFLAGKGSGMQEFHIKGEDEYSKELVTQMKALKASKTNPTDKIFALKRLVTRGVDKGKPDLPNSNSLAKILRETIRVPDGFTMHSFRKLNGTGLAIEQLKKSPFTKSTRPNENEVHEWIMGAMEEVGKILGHVSNGEVTATTALQNYIDPSILEDFFTGLGIRAKPALQGKIDKALGRQ